MFAVMVLLSLVSFLSGACAAFSFGSFFGKVHSWIPTAVMALIYALVAVYLIATRG